MLVTNHYQDKLYENDDEFDDIVDVVILQNSILEDLKMFYVGGIIHFLQERYYWLIGFAAHHGIKPLANPINQ